MPVLKHDLWSNRNEFLKTETWVFLRTRSVTIPRSYYLKFVTGWEIFEVLLSLTWKIA